MSLGPVLLYVLGVDPPDVDANVVRHPGVGERLDDALVGVDDLDIFAADRDVDVLLHRKYLLDHLFPLGEVGLGAFDAELADNDVVEPLPVELKRDLVDRPRVERLDHVLLLHVAEKGYLVAYVPRERDLGTAEEYVGLDTDLPEPLDAVLRRFRLYLVGRLDVRDEGQVNVEDVLPAEVHPKLADRLEKGQPLDVARGAADLRDHDVDAAAVLRRRQYPALDLVGDVRHDLNRPAEVSPRPLPVDYRLVDLARRDVRSSAEIAVDETFVVPEIEIGLGAVVGDEHLAVLKGAHRARIDVEIGIEFLENDLEPALFEKKPQRRGRDAFSEGGDHAARHKDIFSLLAQSALSPGHRPVIRKNSCGCERKQERFTLTFFRSAFQPFLYPRAGRRRDFFLRTRSP